MEKEIVTEIIERAMSGDVEAIDELYRSFAKTILFNVHNMIIDKQNVEDVAQEVAIAVVTGLSKLKSPYAFTSWLHQMIFNVCSTHNKRLKNKQGLDVTLDETEEFSDTNSENIPHKVVEQEQIKNRVLQAIQKLAPAQRSSIVMYYYDEMSYQEIADALGVTINTASTNIRKAKQNLEKMLTEKNSGDALNGLLAAAPLGGLDSLISESLQSGAGEVARDSVVNSFCEKAGISARQYLAHPASVGKAGSLVKVFVALCAAAVVLTVGIVVYGLNSAPADDKPTAVAASAYQPNAEIEMENQLGASNVDPIFANLVLEDAEETEMNWTIIGENETELANGDGDTVSAEVFANLSPGEYKLSWTLKNAENQKAKVRRTFFVN
jgi:RNA polymerase sigma-70 factor (ECF subfamily)